MARRTKGSPERDSEIGAPTHAPDTSQALPESYPKLLCDVRQRIAQSRVRAALSVNRELIRLYWEIGRLIVQRQEREGWGTYVIGRLAADLRVEFPDLSGFSRTSLFRMRAFYLGYTKRVRDVSQATGQSPGGIVSQLARQLDGESLPEYVAEIPWFHNVVLIEKLKDPIERLWYAQKTTEHGWSRAVLVHQIESDLYGRQGRAITNFEQTLPSPQSDLAQQLLKDPYAFDFLGLTDETRERELEESLIDHIQRFLLELGKGFAFVGRQHHMEVGGEDFYLDLLFYHLHLRCFIVIDLKVEPFKPEFAGKMSFYLSAVDDLLRHADDNPTIGLILCKDRNRVVVEYTLRDSTRPLGVATYSLLPDELKAGLPSPEEFEAELQSLEGDER